MTYKDTLDSLYAMMPDFSDVGANAYKPGLERVEKFLRELGSPQHSFITIHVAGTNGKGSVSHMLASVLMAAGYRTGLYTSPHITDFRERIRVDGRPIPEQAVIDFALRNMRSMQDSGLSFFEATVGMAFDWFARTDTEIAVIETGLGGRLDATNVIHPLVSIITNIGMDHMSFLGDNISAIAAEKAGIIKSGAPTVVGQRDPESSPVFETAAKKTGSELFFAEDIFAVTTKEQEENKPSATIYRAENLLENSSCEITLDLEGGYQRHNLTTALSSLYILNRKSPLNLSARTIREGLATAASSTGFRGRWEVAGLSPLTVLDTGHNAHGLAEVVAQIKRQKFDKLYMVFGVADDKDTDSILPLLPRGAHYIFTQAAVGRAMSADLLAAKASRWGLRGDTTRNVTEALDKARSLATPADMIFIGGSTFVVADAVAAMQESV